MRRYLCAATIMAALPSALAAQFTPLDSLSPPSSLAAPISLRLQRTALRVAVAEIASKAKVSIAFDPLLDGLDRAVNVDVANVSAARVLMRTLGDTPLQAMTSTSGSIVLAARPRTERRIVAGTIRQPGGPVSGVHVSLVGTRFETATDVTGRFTFGAVPAGRYGLRAQRMGFAPIDQQIQIGDGEPVLELTMQPIAVPVAAVIVTPGYFGVMQPGLAASQALTRQQIETVPQLGEDVYRAIGRVPGVARDDFSAKFTVRGEPGEGLAVTLDGLPLIEPFHLKDIGAGLSIIDLWSLGGAELITGGPSAEVGDEIGGAFRLRTVEARGDRTRGSVGLSLTNVRGGAQGTFANGNGSWLASGRRGYLDLAFKLAQIEDSIKPTYNDGFIKVAYALPGGGRFAAHALHAGDKFRYRDAREPSVESKYRSDYAWMTLEGRLGDRIRQQSVAWIGDLDWAREGSQAGTNGNLLHLHIDDRRSLRTLGVKQDWALELGSRAMFKFGGVLRRDEASYDYSRLSRRQVLENRVIVMRVDSSAVNIDPTGDRYEMYVAQRVRPFDALTLEAGVRYDRATHTSDAIVSPRVNASWQPTRRTTVRGSWGQHAQSQSVFGLQVEDGVRTFSAAERADQTVVGIDQVLVGGLTARVEAYDRTTSHVRPRYVNAGSNIVMFPEIENDRTLLAPSEGRSRGVEMTISRDAGRRADWSASYTLASAKQRVNGAWLPRLTDQPRAINADWSFHPVANSWRLSLSTVWHSGWPYTPDRIQVDTITTPQGQFAYATFFKGTLYSERVPSYQRVDARWTRFIDTRTGRLSFFVEVYNLLNNTNLRDRYTSVNINRTNVTYFNGTRSQLPRIPSFGFNWEF